MCFTTKGRFFSVYWICMTSNVCDKSNHKRVFLLENSYSLLGYQNVCCSCCRTHEYIYIAQMREQFTYTGLSWNSCKCLNTSQYDPKKKTLTVITDERRFRYLSLNSSKFGLWFMRFFFFFALSFKIRSSQMYVDKLFI